MNNTENKVVQYMQLLIYSNCDQYWSIRLAIYKSLKSTFWYEDNAHEYRNMWQQLSYRPMNGMYGLHGSLAEVVFSEITLLYQTTHRCIIQCNISLVNPSLNVFMNDYSRFLPIFITLHAIPYEWIMNKITYPISSILPRLVWNTAA